MCAYLSVLLKLNVQQEVSIPKYKKYGKLAVAVHVLQIPKTLSFQVIVLQGTAKNCKIYNASVQPVFCSLTVKFDHVAADVVLCFNPIIKVSSRLRWCPSGKMSYARQFQ